VPKQSVHTNLPPRIQFLDCISPTHNSCFSAFQDGVSFCVRLHSQFATCGTGIRRLFDLLLISSVVALTIHPFTNFRASVWLRWRQRTEASERARPRLATPCIHTTPAIYLIANSRLDMPCTTTPSILGTGAYPYVSSHPCPPSFTLFLYNIFGRGPGVLAGDPGREIFQYGLHISCS
jgi:hypothetical protein